MRIPGAGSRWGLLPGVPVSSARGRQLRAALWTAPRRSGIPAVVLATVRRAVQGLRRKAYTREKTMLQDLRHPSAYISSISDVEGLDARKAQLVRVQLETLGYRYNRLTYVWRALNRAGYRLIALAVVPVWLVLLAVVSAAGFTPGPIGMQGYAAISAVVAMIPVIAVVFVLLEPTGQFSRIAVENITVPVIIAFFFAVAVIEAAAGEAYASHFFPTAGWPSAVILGLVVGPAAVAWLPFAAGVVAILLFRQSRRMTRQDPLLTALDSLLLVRYDLKSSDSYRGVPWRLYHCHHLEFAARRMTRDLLPQSSIDSLGSRMADPQGRRLGGGHPPYATADYCPRAGWAGQTGGPAGPRNPLHGKRRSWCLGLARATTASLPSRNVPSPGDLHLARHRSRGAAPGRGPDRPATPACQLWPFQLGTHCNRDMGAAVRPSQHRPHDAREARRSSRSRRPYAHIRNSGHPE